MGRGPGPSKMEQIHIAIEHGPSVAHFFSRSCHYDYYYDDDYE